MSTEIDAGEASGTLTHFQIFSKLPPELRWEIWQMAIYTDETPKIHYYSLFNDDNEGHRESKLQWLMNQFPPNPPKSHPRHADGSLRRIKRPLLKSKPSQFSWTDANRFQYYWNSGLRTACMESRAALHHYQANARRPLPERRDIITAHESAQGRQRVYIEVSRRDIICLRFSPEDMAACVSLEWDKLLTRLPLFHLPQDSDMNLAFEFDDSWNKGLGSSQASVRACLWEPSERGLVMRAFWDWRVGRLPKWTRIWLIDRGAKLPTKHTTGKYYDGRYIYDGLYRMRDSCKEQEDKIFIDGKHKYVESYSWEGQTKYLFATQWHPASISRFIWKLSDFCRPDQEESNHTFNVPNGTFDDFFNVLRLMPEK